VGVNLLREGLDLPEVSMVAILDADKEGFLRSETSLMQTIGRAARNVNAKVILYGDRVTDSMQRAIEETTRRRALQQAYNEEHGITPETIRKSIRVGIESEAAAHAQANAAVGRTDEVQYITEEYIAELEAEMQQKADELMFEEAVVLRERIKHYKASLGAKVSEIEAPEPKGGKKGRGRPGGKGGKGGQRIPRPKRS
jgi:excinuclease ABC subunit B